MKKTILAFAMFAASAAAQLVPAVSHANGLHFLDLQDGDLISSGRGIHVALNRQPQGTSIPAVQFFFTPETGRGSADVGIDRTGMVQGFGPTCATPGCMVPGVYSLTVGNTFATFPTGWGRLSARILGHANDDAFVRVYLSFAPINGRFRQPAFQQALPASKKFPIEVVSLAEDISAVNVKWVLIEPAGDRNVNPFEQHVDGYTLTNNGNGSCVPTAVGANLAWLNDTSQWLTTPSSLAAICGGNRDFCVVSFLGTLMGTHGGGTSGAGADTGLVAYLQAIGYNKGVDYQLTHGPAVTNGMSAPEYLLSHFKAGEMISVGVHNFPGDPGFGHFLALDNILMRPDGSASVRLMDPFTVANPPTVGAYRWFHMLADGTLDWNNGVPAPGYGPASGHLKLDEVQAISDFHFFNFVNNSAVRQGLDSRFTSLATTGITMGQIPVTPQRDGHTWTGEFAPPAGSPGPWLLVSEVTLESGHTQTDHKYVGMPASLR